MAEQPAIYTQYIARAHDPFSGDYMDMHGVWEASTGRVIAYCPSFDDAELIKALLITYGKHSPQIAHAYTSPTAIETTQGSASTTTQIYKWDDFK